MTVGWTGNTFFLKNVLIEIPFSHLISPLWRIVLRCQIFIYLFPLQFHQMEKWWVKHNSFFINSTSILLYWILCFKTVSVFLLFIGWRLWVHSSHRLWDWSLLPRENNSQSSAVFHRRGPGRWRERKWISSDAHTYLHRKPPVLPDIWAKLVMTVGHIFNLAFIVFIAVWRGGAGRRRWRG